VFYFRSIFASAQPETLVLSAKIHRQLSFGPDATLMFAGIPGHGTRSRFPDRLVAETIDRLYASPTEVGFGMHSLLHWLATNGSILAVLITAGVAVLLVCCLGCSNCPAREKDDLFRSRHV